MNTTIIHGNNIVESRKKIDDFLKKDAWVVRFDAQKDDFQKIKDSTESKELFSPIKTLIIENLFSRKSSEKDKIIDLINKLNSPAINIVIWESAEIKKTDLKKILKAEFIFCDLPKFFYSFLDSLIPNNSTKTRKLLKNTLEESSAEQVFYAMVKRTRQLLIIKTGKYHDFEEFKNAQDWQIRKLHSQAKFWKEEKLMEFHKKLFEIEFGLKTSDLPMDLSSHIDFLLFKL